MLEDLQTYAKVIDFAKSLAKFNASLITDLKSNLNIYFRFRTTQEVKSFLRLHIKHNINLTKQDKELLITCNVYNLLVKSIVDLYRCYCYYL